MGKRTERVGDRLPEADYFAGLREGADLTMLDIMRVLSGREVTARGLSGLLSELQRPKTDFDLPSRLNRMWKWGYVSRRQGGSDGRGRPPFLYSLAPKGARYVERVGR